jgi:hypothetical protein
VLAADIGTVGTVQLVLAADIRTVSTVQLVLAADIRTVSTVLLLRLTRGLLFLHHNSIYFTSPPCMPHVVPISYSLISSPE